MSECIRRDGQGRAMEGDLCESCNLSIEERIESLESNNKRLWSGIEMILKELGKAQLTSLLNKLRGKGNDT